MFSDCDTFIDGYILAHHGSYFSLMRVIGNQYGLLGYEETTVKG